MDSITTVDAVIGGLVLLLFTLGYMTGLIFQVAGLIAFAAGTLLALWQGPAVGRLLSGWLTDPGIARLAGYALVFFISGLLVRVIAALISRALEKRELKGVDRFFGGLLGTTKALLVAGVGVFLIRAHGTDGMKADLAASRLGSGLLRVIDLGKAEAERFDAEAKLRQAGQSLRRLAEETATKAAAESVGDQAVPKTSEDVASPKPAAHPQPSPLPEDNNFK